MKTLNKIARVNLRILAVALGVYSLVVLVPRVMAMPLNDAVSLQPYGALAVLLGMLSTFLQFAQRQFRRVKRLFDLLVAAVSLVLVSPLIGLFALLIKLISPNGPVFYSQVRLGRYGRTFQIYKLRSMVPDAEKASGAVWAQEGDDPRELPFIGKFLRKTHIDEIPQFFNVLKGDMSVVGPRPERPEIVEKLKMQIPEYEKRLNVRPGITGLAQIRNRYDASLKDVKKKVKLDLLYIRKMCLFVELNILFRTLLVVFKGRVI